MSHKKKLTPEELCKTAHEALGIIFTAQDILNNCPKGFQVIGNRVAMHTETNLVFLFPSLDDVRRSTEISP
jgi:hypothetical protein